MNAQKAKASGANRGQSQTPQPPTTLPRLDAYRNKKVRCDVKYWRPMSRREELAHEALRDENRRDAQAWCAARRGGLPCADLDAKFRESAAKLKAFVQKTEQITEAYYRRVATQDAVGVAREDHAVVKRARPRAPRAPRRAARATVGESPPEPPPRSAVVESFRGAVGELVSLLNELVSRVEGAESDRCESIAVALHGIGASVKREITWALGELA